MHLALLYGWYHLPYNYMPYFGVSRGGSCAKAIKYPHIHTHAKRFIVIWSWFTTTSARGYMAEHFSQESTDTVTVQNRERVLLNKMLDDESLIFQSMGQCPYNFIRLTYWNLSQFFFCGGFTYNQVAAYSITYIYICVCIYWWKPKVRRKFTVLFDTVDTVATVI